MGNVWPVSKAMVPVTYVHNKIDGKSRCYIRVDADIRGLKSSEGGYHLGYVRSGINRIDSQLKNKWHELNPGFVCVDPDNYQSFHVRPRSCWDPIYVTIVREDGDVIADNLPRNAGSHMTVDHSGVIPDREFCCITRFTKWLDSICPS